jgi:type IV fimbrial biogenesis protein FimT
MFRKTHGFTALEMLAALAIAAALAGIAVPAYSHVAAAARSESARSDLFESLATALRHSMVVNAEVVACASRDGSTCTGGTDWTPGWIVFTDRDPDRIPGPGEAIIRRYAELKGGVHLRSTAGRRKIVFQPQGGASAGSNVTFTLCDDRGVSKAISLVLDNAGRLRTGHPTTSAAIACLDPVE